MRKQVDAEQVDAEGSGGAHVEQDLCNGRAASKERVHQRRPPEAVHSGGVHALLQEPLRCRHRALCGSEVQRRASVVVPHISNFHVVLQHNPLPGVLLQVCQAGRHRGGIEAI